MKGLILAGGLYVPAAVPCEASCGRRHSLAPPATTVPEVERVGGQVCKVNLAPGTAQRAMWNREQSS